MDKVLERLKHEFVSQEARYAYADSVTNSFLTAQIKELRDDQGLTQEKFAELVGTQQSGISRWQNSGYSSCKVETLRKFARAFGVRLRITFEEFGSLPEDVRGFTRERLAPRKFDNDPAFRNETEQARDAEAIKRAANATGNIEDQIQPFPFSSGAGKQASPQQVPQSSVKPCGVLRFKFRRQRSDKLKVKDAAKRKQSISNPATGHATEQERPAA